jgi:O-antigen biosynthesis protein
MRPGTAKETRGGAPPDAGQMPAAAGADPPHPGDSPDGSPVRCSLIVLNYDERELVVDCVRSMIAAVGPDDEIIVVDNGSTDGSADAVSEAFPSVRVLRLPENRYIFSLNAGLAMARGTYVAFCNNDMTVEPNFVEQALRCFDSEDIFAVCARVLDRNGVDQGTRTAGNWIRGLIFYQPLPHTPDVTDCFFAVGGQSFFRRDLLVDLGSIDELLWPMYHEDIELSYRAWRCGYRIVYAPDSVCHHRGGQTSRNELLIVWKDVTDRQMMTEHVLWIVPRLLSALVRGDWGTIIGFFSALRRAPRAWRARKEARARFTKSDREVLALVSATAIDGRARGSADRT